MSRSTPETFGEAAVPFADPDQRPVAAPLVKTQPAEPAADYTTDHAAAIVFACAAMNSSRLVQPRRNSGALRRAA